MNEGQNRRLPVALTVAGSDSGGGAGIQADLKTFASFGVHGTSAVTCLTAQNPTEVRDVEPVSARMVAAQIEAVATAFPVGAAKTGMLYSTGIIQAITEVALLRSGIPWIMDPVMVATSGAVLLRAEAIGILQRELLPRCRLVTPNLHEAELLGAREVKSLDDLKAAAKQIHDRYGCAVLLKGGHLRDYAEAVDCYYEGQEMELLRSAFVKGVTPHGTGCALSAAIAAGLAHGRSLREAIGTAKRFVSGAIERYERVGKHAVLHLF